MLEFAAFMVALAAATVAYLELRTIRDERLTPYRAVIFTTQLDSYRELTRLRDRFQWLSAYNGATTPDNVHYRERVSETAIPRPEFLCMAFEGRAGYGEQTLDSDISELLVALVAADAVWPQRITRDLESVRETLNHLRSQWSALRANPQISGSPPQPAGQGPNFRECELQRRQMGQAYEALDARLRFLLERMRTNLRFDQIVTPPPD